MEKYAELIYVDVDNGKTKQSNKFYKMKQSGDKILVEYGRVGKNPQYAEYELYEWDKLLTSKVKKGYKDVTSLRSETKSVNNFIDITDKEVNDLINILQNYSKKSIQQNYTISSESVTEAMVEEAQKVIDNITKLINIGQKSEQVNKLLLELYKIIPRQMKDVRSYILKNDITNQKELEVAQKLIGDEQSTLDVMRQQVEGNKLNKKASESSNKVNILDAMGLEIKPITDKSVIENIKSLMGPEANHFFRAFEVENKKTRNNFNNFVAKSKNKAIKLFWHGSRNENIFGIIDLGLLIRPAGAIHSGSMFGDGIYMANKFKKSLGYTSFRGSYWANGNDNRAFLFLFECHIGNQLNIYKHDSSCYKLSKNILSKDNFDSVYAHGGADLRNDEFIMYDPNQVTIKYLIEIK